MLNYWYFIPSIVLTPLLIKQGLETRKKVLRMPEAKGRRSGLVGHGKKLKLLILGDSAGAGVGVKHQEQALSGQVSVLLQKTHQLDWSLIATSGHSTQDALENLKQYPSETESYDVVLISLGVNDVTGFVSPKKWIKQCDELINLLSNKFSAKRIVWSDFPKMEKFPSLPQPLRWFIGSRKDHLRKHLVKYVALKENVDLLEFPDVLSQQGENIKDWIAIDGFHPGPRVYRIWAEEFVNHLLNA